MREARSDICSVGLYIQMCSQPRHFELGLPGPHLLLHDVLNDLPPMRDIIDHLSLDGRNDHDAVLVPDHGVAGADHDAAAGYDAVALPGLATRKREPKRWIVPMALKIGAEFSSGVTMNKVVGTLKRCDENCA